MNYIITKFKLNGKWNFDISQEGSLEYSDLSPTHHGMQCNHRGGTPEHEEIFKKCDQVAQLMREIDALNNPEQ